jgi:hypothetical protein
VDETRAVEVVSTWADPSRFAETVTRAYRRNKWAAQSTRLEVWSEKGTVRGTLAPILERYEVPFRVMHGFASATTVHEIAATTAPLDKWTMALYVGDWDPSGLHMSEVDLPARLRDYGAGLVDVRRIALTEDDCAALGAELAFPLASKRGDPRHAWYLANQARDADGDWTEDPGAARCWELDALSPVVLRERVEAQITHYLDRETWARYVHAETVERESIVATVSAWRDLAAAGTDA